MLAAACLMFIVKTGLEADAAPPPARPAAVPPAVPDEPSPSSYRGDLSLLKGKGRLRVLYMEGETGARERQLLEQYGASQGLAAEWLPVDNPWQMLTALAEGRGDLAASVSEPVHAGPSMPVRDTLSWGVSRQQVVGRDSNGVIDEPADLSVRQVAVRDSSPAWTTLAAVNRDAPAMDIVTIPDRLTDEQVLERVSSGRYDLAVMDSQSLQPLLADYPDLKVQISLGDPEQRRWLVHAGADHLHRSLNRFLNKKHLEMNLARVYREDLPSLKRRKVLRLISHRSPVNVFFDNGRLKGFEYDLVRRFAEQQGLRVDVVFAANQEEMRSLLLQGRGDIIAAALPARSLSGRTQLGQTHPYNFTTPLLVGNSDDVSLQGPEDLSGRRIYLPEESPWRDMLESLRQRGIDLQIMDATGHNTEAVLFRVAQGLYDLTVIGSHEMKAEFGRQLNLKAHFPLSEPQPQVWAVRRSDTRLLSALNGYIDKEYRRGFYNVIRSKYIEHPGSHKASSRLLADVDRLSPFDRIVYRYADHYGFDWRLIVAQMYQESRFDPAAVSYAGAEGLMQLLPGTAQQMGVEQRADPVNSIQGGIRYLDYLRGRFDDIALLEDRTWFTLAAYNAGFRRVRQARQLTEKMGLDPNRWFDNVENAMLAMAQPYRKDGEWSRLCRCGQTVVYVREIRTLYNNYVRLTRSVRTAESRRQGETRPVFN